MRRFGAAIETDEATFFHVDNQQRYIGHDFEIEPDASAASYFLGAAAVTGCKVFIKNLSRDSLQGDTRFVKVLEEMGGAISNTETGIEFRGISKLHGIDVDMNDLPDCVPTLAVVALFAEGPTMIGNIGHLRFKETNRLVSIATELQRLGAKVELTEESMTIYPKKLHGASIETYNDHRMAMAFAIAGLKVEGVAIQNPGCVGKSFPAFWDEFSKLETKG
jgi:3-phosphoshikimate 1-carboxyvinyltransferase